MPPRHRRRFRTGRRLATAGAVVVCAAAALAVSLLTSPSPTNAGTGSRRHASSGGGHGNGGAKGGGGGQGGPATFSGPDGVEARWVVRENEKPGTTAWKITGNQTPTGIAGYANRVQARQGQQVTLYVSTAAASFHVEAYRMGYYQGKGARLVWQSGTVPGQVQPSCPVTPGINMVQCHWAASTQFTVTSKWVQGEYLLKLVGSDGQQSYVPLTVWDPSSHATYVVMEGVLTEQVFNPYGGYDLYQGATPCAHGVYPCSSRSRVVSFDRPYAGSFGNGAGSFLSLTYPLIRLMEQHGLDVTYWTDITLHEHGTLLPDHKVLISTGHDEEWSLQMRNAARNTGRDKGVNLIFFGASPVLRKVRLQPSPLGPDRQIVNYRDPTADPVLATDPAQVSQNTWGQSPANLPPSVLVGGTYIGFNNTQSFPLVVSNPSSWLFAGTGLSAGAKIPGVLRADFQQYQPTGENPANVEILAHSPVTVPIHANPAGFADTSYYTMPSGGAGVFSSGANSWIPSLADCPATTPASACGAPMMRKLTDNLLRVFGQGPVGQTQPSTANWQQFYG